MEKPEVLKNIDDKILDDFVNAKLAEIQKQKEEDNKKNNQNNQNNNSQNNNTEQTVRERVQKKIEEEEIEKQSKKKLENAISFNLTIEDVLTKKNTNKVIPDTIFKIINEHKGKDGDHVEKANELRKDLILEYFADKSNIEILPEMYKLKYREYEGLTKTQQLIQSSNYFELVDLAINQKELIKKTENIKKANLYGNIDTSADNYVKKFYKIAEEKMLRKKVEVN